MNPTLNYHRRHTSTCEGNHPIRLYTNEYDERKKAWKKCRCPIYASGSLNRIAKRFPTKRTEWQDAKDLMAPYLAANSWDLNRPPPPSGAPPPPPVSSGDNDLVPEVTRGKRETIPNAIQIYLGGHQQDESSSNTQRLYRYSLANLQAYSDQIGLRWVHEWSRPLVVQLRASWRVSPLTATKKHGNVKAFFEFCVQNEWITFNPARFKTRRNRKLSGGTDLRQRLPYSDADLERMFEACRTYDAGELRNWPKKKAGRVVETISSHREYYRAWTGEDLIDFICVSVYTGLRISDVATFHIDRLSENGAIHIRTIKSQGETKVYTRVPEWLTQRIIARSQRVGPLIFGAHTTTDINVITEGWRKRLNLMWKQCGPWKEKPVPHRFRHTFARILLQAGRPVSVVAELMGNTEAVVRKHYKAFVKEHQDYLDEVLRGAFQDAPRPDQPRRSKVQAITG